MTIKTGVIGSVLMDTARKVIRPVVRLLLVNGVSFPAMSEMLKQVLVDVAEEQLRQQGQKVNDSRISVATGVHRKDVRRLRVEVRAEENEPGSISLGSRVVNTWLSEPRWLRKNGKPRVLKRNNGDASRPSFEDLATSISNDVHPRTMLEELLRIGVVHLTEHDRVALDTEAFIPSKGLEEKLFYFELGARSHLSASVHNVLGGEPAFFERLVHYDRVPRQSLPALTQLVDTQGMAFLKQVNQATREQDDPDTPHPQQLSVGLYVYYEPLEQKTGSDDEAE